MCCGLFNFKDISRESLARYLYRPLPSLDQKEVDQYGIAYLNRDDIRDVTSHICPYQGFLSEGKPGCRIHPAVSGTDMRDLSLFGKTICDRFLCPAHRLLNNREKMFLKKNIRDWYCYSIAIIDPGTFSWVLHEIEKRYDVDAMDNDTITRVLEESLLIHAKYLNAAEHSLFYYSVPEYMAHRETCRVCSETTNAQKEREEIVRVIDSLFL